MLCFPAEVGDASTTYGADPKGSPDGTKVTFVSNYDLKDGPVTFLASEIPSGGGALSVRSTRGFPARGALVIRSEVIAYERITATTFEGLTRQQYGTARAPARAGQPVTSFEARTLSEEQWQKLGKPSQSMRALVRDPNSPLLRQRQTDVHVVVVRRPDSPVWRVRGESVELIPGEEHRETRGYRLLRDGQPVGPALWSPGERTQLSAPGEYRAIAVERSGLESELGPLLQVTRPVSIQVLQSPPGDFSWTFDRWRVGEQTVTAAAAQKAPAALREIVHVQDGVIAREWYRHGTIISRHDLNRAGQPTRQLVYQDGKLAAREYVAEGRRMSREVFEPGGYIVETITFDPETGAEKDHWWFERGIPIRQLKDGREFRRVENKWTAVAAGAGARAGG